MNITVAEKIKEPLLISSPAEENFWETKIFPDVDTRRSFEKISATVNQANKIQNYISHFFKKDTKNFANIENGLSLILNYSEDEVEILLCKPSAEFQNHLVLIIRTIIAELKNKKKTISEEDYWRGFEHIRELFFSYSPNIFEIIPFDLQIELGVLSYETDLGEKFLNYLAPRFNNLSPASQVRIIEQIDFNSIGQVLKLIRFLQKLNYFITENTCNQETIEQLLNKIRAQNSSKFIELAIELGKYRHLTEYTKNKSVQAFKKQLHTILQKIPLGQKFLEKKRLQANFFPIEQTAQNTYTAYTRDFTPFAFCQAQEFPLSYTETREHFINYVDLPRDPKLNPFPQANDADLPQLLQELHSPGMIELISQKLQIRIDEIPLPYQIHLLRFLQDKDQSVFNRLQKILNINPKLKNKIITAFLACAENRQMGKIIIELAELADSKPEHQDQVRQIFETYQKLTEKIETLSLKLYQIYQEGSPYKTLTQLDIYRTLIQKGTKLLNKASTVLKSTAPSQQKSTLLKKEIRKLVQTDENIMLTIHFISSLPRHEVATFPLEKITTLQVFGPTPVEQFRNSIFNQQILEQMKQKKLFPQEEIREYENVFLSRPNAAMTVVSCAQKIASGIGTYEMGQNSNIYSVEWLFSGEIKGLAETLLRKSLHDLKQTECGIFGAAHAYIKSTAIMLEKGLNARTIRKFPEEEYFLCFSAPEEKDCYPGKKLSPLRIKNFLKDKKPQSPHPFYLPTGELIHLAWGEYHNPLSNPDCEDWFKKLFREMNQQNYILTVDLPDQNYHQEHQSHWYVFEQDRLSPEGKAWLEKTLQQEENI